MAYFGAGKPPLRTCPPSTLLFVLPLRISTSQPPVIFDCRRLFENWGISFLAVASYLSLRTMERSSSVRFQLGRQSSRASLNEKAAPEVALEAVPELVVEAGEQDFSDGSSEDHEENAIDDIPTEIMLMYAANEGDLEGIKELLDSGANVNYRDIDDRTPLHVAACQGYGEVAELLIDYGAEVEAKDRWGSTPLADAIHYKNYMVVSTLEKHGAAPVAKSSSENSNNVPDYEIDPCEIDFTNSVEVTKGTVRTASWRGLEVAVKKVGDDICISEDQVMNFRDELALLQRVRHPNVVQFLGAVTQSNPMMMVIEYLPKGDLREYLNNRGQLKPALAVKFALDIARGMNYLHENKPVPIIHRDLEPSNILRDDSGNVKVADFGVSKLLMAAKEVEDGPLVYEDTCRYMAPELLRSKEYDTKVDVFSFALILQEMIEGCPPFPEMNDAQVREAYIEKHRPPFKASGKLYSHGLKDLIEECWRENPADRPTFRRIIAKLCQISRSIGHRKHWKVRVSCIKKNISGGKLPFKFHHRR